MKNPAEMAAQQAADNAIVAGFLELRDRLSLTDTAAAGLTGTSTHTVRVLRMAREMPAQARVRARITRFVQLNRAAQTRQELRIA